MYHGYICGMGIQIHTSAVTLSMNGKVHMPYNDRNAIYKVV